MKIYKREDFLSLPAGTIYCQGEPWVFESIAIKGDTLRLVNKDDAGDFCCLYLGVDADDSGEETNRLNEMLENGASYPMNESYQRDGCFEKDAVFLVFEPDDLKRLIGLFEQAIKQEIL